jgi:hypothetical protein
MEKPGHAQAFSFGWPSRASCHFLTPARHGDKSESFRSAARTAKRAMKVILRAGLFRRVRAF